MADDLVKRARQALALNEPRRTQPAVIDKSRTDDLVKRAREAIKDRPQQFTSVPRPVVKPPVAEPSSVEKVRVQGGCSATGKPFVVIAERRGDQLRFIANETARETQGNAAPPATLSGDYEIDQSGWSCPHCGSDDGVWTCSCEPLRGMMHCKGSKGGLYHCYCGKLEERQFQTVERLEVRGRSMASTSRGSPNPQRGLVPFSRDR